MCSSDLNPAGLAGVVLLSPYFQLGFKPPAHKVVAAKLVNGWLAWLPVPSEVRIEDLTHDVQQQAATRADPLYLSIATPRWFLESTAAQEAVPSLAAHVKVPTLVAVGLQDRVASPAAGKAFYAALSVADRRLIEYPEMRHELLNELGREAVFRDISDWISLHL